MCSSRGAYSRGEGQFADLLYVIIKCLLVEVAYEEDPEEQFSSVPLIHRRRLKKTYIC